MIKNRIFALIFRLGASLFLFCGVLASLGIFADSFSGTPLLYYTLQSNVLALIMFALLTVRTALALKREGKFGSAGFYPRLNLAVMVCIMLTLVVFWTLLVPFMEISYLLSFRNLSVHLVSPLLCLADYIMFSEGGKLKKYDPLLFSVIPLGYFIQATVLGFSGVSYGIFEDTIQHFPYFFIDYYVSGAWVALYVFAIAATYTGVCFLLLFIDRRRFYRSEKREKNISS